MNSIPTCILTGMFIKSYIYHATTHNHCRNDKVVSSKTINVSYLPGKHWKAAARITVIQHLVPGPSSKWEVESAAVLDIHLQFIELWWSLMTQAEYSQTAYSPVMSIGSRAKASSSLGTSVVWSVIVGNGSTGSTESGLSGPPTAN